MPSENDEVETVLDTEDLRKLFRGELLEFELNDLIRISPKVSVAMIRQALDDVEREQREKDQAQQNPNSGSVVSG